jgi:hypothetical protein
MLGAVIGDISGSIYEFKNHRSKDFPFFGEGANFTDDTVLTVAVADAPLNDKPVARVLFSSGEPDARGTAFAKMWYLDLQKRDSSRKRHIVAGRKDKNNRRPLSRPRSGLDAGSHREPRNQE